MATRMIRTLFIFIIIQVLLTNSISPWRLRPRFFASPQLRTFSSSPAMGPNFISAKSFLTVLPNNAPVLPLFEETVITEEISETIVNILETRDETLKTDGEVILKTDDEENLFQDFNCDLQKEERDELVL